MPLFGLKLRCHIPATQDLKKLRFISRYVEIKTPIPKWLWIFRLLWILFILKINYRWTKQCEYKGSAEVCIYCPSDGHWGNARPPLPDFTRWAIWIFIKIFPIFNDVIQLKWFKALYRLTTLVYQIWLFGSSFNLSYSWSHLCLQAPAFSSESSDPTTPC